MFCLSGAYLQYMLEKQKVLKRRESLEKKALKKLKDEVRKIQQNSYLTTDQKDKLHYAKELQKAYNKIEEKQKKNKKNKDNCLWNRNILSYFVTNGKFEREKYKSKVCSNNMRCKPYKACDGTCRERLEGHNKTPTCDRRCCDGRTARATPATRAPSATRKRHPSSDSCQSILTYPVNACYSYCKPPPLYYPSNIDLGQCCRQWLYLTCMCLTGLLVWLPFFICLQVFCCLCCGRSCC